MSFQRCQIIGSGVDPKSYHESKGVRGAANFVMSPSALKAFAVCPSRWVAGYSMPESDARKWGSLLDTLLLTPELFKARYCIPPTHYERDGERKEWRNDKRMPEVRAWMEANAGKEQTTAAAVADCQAAIKRLMADPVIAAFHEASDKQVHLAGEWHDEATGITVPVECLMDYVPRVDTEFAKCAGDLKTTTNAALLPFQRWCFTAGYHIQAAFDLDMLVAATGEDRQTWTFILSENYAPWEPGKRILSQDLLGIGRNEYARLLSNYCQCVKAGRWPGYDDTDENVQGWGVVEAEPFMQERAMFAPKFDFNEPAATEDEPAQEPEDVPTP